MFCFCFVFCTVLFPTGPGGRKIQKMTPPSLQFDPKRQQYNTGPNDTLKTYMPIFRKKRNSFRASVWPDRHIAKWGAGGAPPEGVFNNHSALSFAKTIIIVKRMMAKRTARTTIAVEPSDPPVHSSHLPPSTGAKLGAHVEQRRFVLTLL